MGIEVTSDQPGSSPNSVRYKGKLNMQQVLVINDERFTQHLEQVPHLENAKRIRASHSLMQDPSLRGRWTEVEPRMASREEPGL